MRLTHAPMVLAALVTCGPRTSPVAYDGVPCRVTRVTDGDSFYCDGGKRVRLIGIDAPELDQGEPGRASQAGLSDLMPVGAVVRLETDVRPEDPYRRILAYAWQDSVMVNREMVRAGWAMLYTVPPNVRYVGLLTAAQDSARRERRGHWGTEGFACAPARHRRGEC